MSDAHAGAVLTPPLKWAGGKRWLVASQRYLFPTEFNTYVEPFVGGAAVFFALQPRSALLSDACEELIETYQAIRDDWKRVWCLLKRHHEHHCRTYYYYMRRQQPRTPATRAARFIYLNRTCFNGLYRVNQQAQFNVPMGSKKWAVHKNDNFAAIAASLRCVRLVRQDFQVAVDQCHEGDLLYLDPPYTVRHNSNNFRRYNEAIFRWGDQVRLRDCLFRARDRGVQIVLSNADNNSIRQLYRGFGRTRQVKRPSTLAADAARRRNTTELLFTANLDASRERPGR